MPSHRELQREAYFRLSLDLEKNEIPQQVLTWGCFYLIPSLGKSQSGILDQYFGIRETVEEIN